MRGLEHSGVGRPNSAGVQHEMITYWDVCGGSEVRRCGGSILEGQTSSRSHLPTSARFLSTTSALPQPQPHRVHVCASALLR